MARIGVREGPYPVYLAIRKLRLKVMRPQGMNAIGTLYVHCKQEF
jgi:hypothetical protein